MSKRDWNGWLDPGVGSLPRTAAKYIPLSEARGWGDGGRASVVGLGHEGWVVGIIPTIKCSGSAQGLGVNVSGLFF